MTDKGILEKAIQKAIDGGWLKEVGVGTVIVRDVSMSNPKIWVSIGLFSMALEELIFNHDFAKALWGAHKLVGVQMTDAEYVYQWQYHLQLMVIADDPIKYLGENI